MYKALKKYFQRPNIFVTGSTTSKIDIFPDAEKILNARNIGGFTQLLIIDPDGTNEVNISPRGAGVTHRAVEFSRDGRWLPWSDSTSGTSTLYMAPFTLKNGVDIGNIIQISDPILDPANGGFPLTVSSDNDVVVYCAGPTDRSRLVAKKISTGQRVELATGLPDSEFKLSVAFDEDENYIFMCYGQFETNLNLIRYDWDQATLSISNSFTYPRVAGDGSGPRRMQKIIRFNQPVFFANNKTAPDWPFRNIVKYSNLTLATLGTITNFDGIGNFVRDTPRLNETGLNGIFPALSQVGYTTNEFGDTEIYRKPAGSNSGNPGDRVQITNNVVSDGCGDWLILPGE